MQGNKNTGEFGEWVLSDVETLNFNSTDRTDKLVKRSKSKADQKEYTKEKWNITTFTFLCSWNHVWIQWMSQKHHKATKTVFYKSKTVLCASFKKDKPLQKETEFTFINPVWCVCCVVRWSGTETLNTEWRCGVILNDVSCFRGTMNERLQGYIIVS